MKSILKAVELYAATLLLVVLASSASALSISNVLYTDNSVTFTADGVMPTSPLPFGVGGDDEQFSLRYGGDIVSGLVPESSFGTQNTIFGSLFDGITPLFEGDTGGYNFSTTDWTVIEYDVSLAGAIATNNTVTIQFADNFLNVGATNPSISFIWGNGSEDLGASSTVLATVAPAAAVVPLPATFSLLFGGVGFLVLLRRRSI